MPDAKTQAGTFLRPGADRNSAPSAGHAATHSIQPVHSADRIVINRSTGREDGHALAHFAQSMQRSGTRRMRSGLAKDTNPIKAPYGHRYRHQKFLATIDPTTSTPSVTKPVVSMCRKKLSIFTSSTTP